MANCLKLLQNELAGDSYIDTNKLDVYDKLDLQKGNFDELTDSQESYLFNYQTADYKDINGYLRGDVPILMSKSEVNKSVSVIDNAMTKSELKDNMILYRGLNAPSSEMRSILKTGTVFTDKSYVSTTMRYDIASHFSKTGSSGNASAYVFEIYAPKGSNAIMMNRIIGSGQIGSEFEVLLDRNSRFKVLEIEKLKTLTKVKVKLL